MLSDESYEKAHLYQKVAQKHKIDVCFFRLEDINFQNKNVLVRFKKDPGAVSWQIKQIPIPRVIHNRAIYGLSKLPYLKKLSAMGATVYNYWNGYSKLKIHRLIEKKGNLQKYLADTRRFQYENLRYFLKYNSFFLKPDKGSVGNGIIKIDRFSLDSWKITHQIKSSKKIYIKKENELYSFLSNYIAKQRYILQKSIRLQTYQQSPFDVRVSAQKNEIGQWQVTGMVGKVASQGCYLSNLFQGGTVKTLETIYGRSAVHVKKRLAKAAIDIASYLSKQLPNLADIGFDFGIDNKGNVIFIEMNSRDQRYSFLLAGMNNTFEMTYENPVAYGKYLLKRKLRQT